MIDSLRLSRANCEESCLLESAADCRAGFSCAAQWHLSVARVRSLPDVLRTRFGCVLSDTGWPAATSCEGSTTKWSGTWPGRTLSTSARRPSCDSTCSLAGPKPICWKSGIPYVVCVWSMISLPIFRVPSRETHRLTGTPRTEECRPSNARPC